MKTSMILGAFALALAGCSSISPAGMIAASRLDPLETPPSDLAVAVSVPRQMRLRDGDATMYLAFEPEDSSISPVAATAPLSVTTNGDGPPSPRPEMLTYTFSFGPEAAAQLAATQTQIKNLRAQGVEGKGTLSIGVEGGCLTGDLDDHLLVATWLRTSPNADFVQMTRETDLLDVLSDEDRVELLANLEACRGTSFPE